MEAFAPVLFVFVIFVLVPASWILLWAFARWVKNKVPYSLW